MKERPIIFGAESVRAILAGAKTQTRRVVLHRHAFKTHHEKCTREEARDHDSMALRLRPEDEAEATAWLREHCRYGVPGDRLWVRETWAPWPGGGTGWQVFRAEPERPYEPDRWRSPIQMPRWASRITLELTDVRVQRVQEISEEDARAEGVEPCDCATTGVPKEWCSDKPYHHGFAGAWDQINGKRAPWDGNPWVWALTFRRKG